MPIMPADVHAKLLRAVALWRELGSLNNEYLGGVEQRQDVVLLREQQAYRVRLQLDPAPPASMAVIFGEILQHLRSSLDYLARDLVIAHGASPRDGGPGSTQFPIHVQRPKNPLRILPAVAPEALRTVEALQPFHAEAPDGHPLARLQELNNHDKHRLLHLTSLSGSGQVVFVPEAASQVTITPEMPKHRIELLSGEPQLIRVRPEEMFKDARVTGMWSSTVVLGAPGTSWSEQLLLFGQRLIEHVGDVVVPALAPHLAPVTKGQDPESD